MALVSGRRSTLNPNAPLFVPAAYREVEDFSPEWWQLVTSSSWYRDYWISQNQDAEGFYDNAQDSGFDSCDVADLLPDTFDLDAAGESFQFEELEDSFEDELETKSSPFSSDVTYTNGFDVEVEAPIKDAKTTDSEIRA